MRKGANHIIGQKSVDETVTNCYAFEACLNFGVIYVKYFSPTAP